MFRQIALSFTSCTLFMICVGFFMAAMVQAMTAPKPDHYYYPASPTAIVGNFK